MSLSDSSPRDYARESREANESSMSMIEQESILNTGGAAKRNVPFTF